MFYFSLYYVGLSVSVISIILTDYFSCRDIYIQNLSCFPLSKSAWVKMRWYKREHTLILSSKKYYEGRSSPPLSAFPTNSLTWFVKWSMNTWLDTDVGHATGRVVFH